MRNALPAIASGIGNETPPTIRNVLLLVFSKMAAGP